MMKARRGVTLIEVMLAGSIIAISTLALFEGITVASKIARENADLLTAEAIVWDAVWRRFNEDLSTLSAGMTTQELTEEAAGSLFEYDTPPMLSITVASVPNNPQLTSIEGNLEWGPSERRKTLSDTQRVFVYRGQLGRVTSW